ncbi:MAG: PfkB family carbohydrate kinase [Planctomycetaceae bacterium]|jgi:sugar/nucleoside kinase (ribokinase family)|nr:PfkB family carbohydrate kinase [Planctomycetaceae bacterium]
MKAEIVGIGACVYDTLIELTDFPAEDTKSYINTKLSGGGGPCATSLVTAARLGAQTAYVGTLTDDFAGGFLYDDFKKYGVVTDFILIKKNYRSFSAFVLLNKKTGSRTCLLDHGNLPPLQLNSKQIDAIKNADILIVDGNEIEAAIHGATIAHAAGKKVLYDAGGIYANIEPLLALTNILIPSEEFAKRFTSENSAELAAKKLYKTFRPDIVVVTKGKNGGIMCWENNIVSYPAFPVDTVDSNGAGDVFHGAFAFFVAQGFSYEKCCLFSSSVSALKCTRIGSRQGTPTYQQTIQFLKERGIYEL